VGAIAKGPDRINEVWAFLRLKTWCQRSESIRFVLSCSAVPKLVFSYTRPVGKCMPIVPLSPVPFR